MGSYPTTGEIEGSTVAPEYDPLEARREESLGSLFELVASLPRVFLGFGRRLVHRARKR